MPLILLICRLIHARHLNIFNGFKLPKSAQDKCSSSYKIAFIVKISYNLVVSMWNQKKLFFLQFHLYDCYPKENISSTVPSFRDNIPRLISFCTQNQNKIKQLSKVVYFNIPFLTIYFNLAYFVNHGVICVATFL